VVTVPQECLDDLEGFAERGGMVPFIGERVREHARRLDAEHALGTRSSDRMQALCAEVQRLVQAAAGPRMSTSALQQLIDRSAERVVLGRFQLYQGLQYLRSERARSRALLGIVRSALRRHMPGADLTPVLEQALGLAIRNFQGLCEDRLAPGGSGPFRPLPGESQEQMARCEATIVLYYAIKETLAEAEGGEHSPPWRRPRGLTA
jgi:hypothetical protein